MSVVFFSAYIFLLFCGLLYAVLAIEDLRQEIGVLKEINKHLVWRVAALKKLHEKEETNESRTH